MRVLAGDLGATNCRLALVETETFRLLDEAVYPSREHDGLHAAVERFAGEVGVSFDAACFGVPGPVRAGQAKLTNLPWVVDAEELGAELDRPVVVINDLEAAAWSLDLLGSTEVISIYEPAGAEEVEGNRALIAPGTGLGEAGLFWDGSEHRPFATEGGHAAFAPADGLEWELRSALASRHGRVSWERVLSGPGLVEIHRFLRSYRRGGRGCPVDEMPSDDPMAGPAITRAAGDGSCRACVESIERFCRLLGAEAGDLALELFAVGGVWIGGGIARSIVGELADGPFLEGFLDKGRMRSLVEAIPVRVILSGGAALRGAARAAHRLTRSADR